MPLCRPFWVVILLKEKVQTLLWKPFRILDESTYSGSINEETTRSFDKKFKLLIARLVRQNRKFLSDLT